MRKRKPGGDADTANQPFAVFPLATGSLLNELL